MGVDPGASVRRVYLKLRGSAMALDQELQDDLGYCLARTDLGSLTPGPNNASEKHMVYELLANQLTIMQVLAAMNGMNPNPKAYRHLVGEDGHPAPRNPPESNSD